MNQTKRPQSGNGSRLVGRSGCRSQFGYAGADVLSHVLFVRDLVWHAARTFGEWAEHPHSHGSESGAERRRDRHLEGTELGEGPVCDRLTNQSYTPFVRRIRGRSLAVACYHGCNWRNGCN